MDRVLILHEQARLLREMAGRPDGDTPQRLRVLAKELDEVADKLELDLRRQRKVGR